ncbi:MAG: Ig domain-containing protein, partial [Burkholderiales bacterium]|nr:Ig domain-containing protein [Burkholderiales bacterium]
SPYSYAVTVGALPTGLSLDPDTGAISGTPAAAGSYTFTVTVTDDEADTDSEDFTIVIAAAPPPPLELDGDPQDGQVSVTYSDDSIVASGGTSPYDYAVTAGALPPGLSLNPDTAEISGTPTAIGSYTFTVTVTDDEADTDSEEFTIVIAAAPPPPLELDGDPQDGQVSVTYSDDSIVASGGTSPYSYAVTVGALPTGLAINSVTGAISGTPTTVGSYTFTVTVTDDEADTDSEEFTIVIAAAPPPPLELDGDPQDGQVSVTYSDDSIVASGGTSPYDYAVTVGALPPGLAINTVTGAISGTPTAAGSYTFTVTVTDNDTTTASAEFSIDIAPMTPTQLTLTDNLMNGQVGVNYIGDISASGGTSPYSYAVTAGALPPGLSLNPVTGEISGTPTTEGVYSFTITATDSNNNTVDNVYTVRIALYAKSSPTPIPVLPTPFIVLLAFALVGIGARRLKVAKN